MLYFRRDYFKCVMNSPQFRKDAYCSLYQIRLGGVHEWSLVSNQTRGCLLILQSHLRLGHLDTPQSQMSLPTNRL